MRHWNRLALGALAATIVAIAAGAGAYAMRGSDEPSVLYEWEPGTPPADAAPLPAPGGGPAGAAGAVRGGAGPASSRCVSPAGARRRPGVIRHVRA